jgi:beta-N-acetylhexosaminidase
MRRQRLAALIALLAIVLAGVSAYALLAGHGQETRAVPPTSLVPPSSAPTGPASPAGTATAVDRREAEVSALLGKMTLPEKVGQLFMTYVYGASASDRDPQMVAENRRLTGASTGAELIAAYHLGGIVYLQDYTLDSNSVGTRNLQSPHQIARLSNGLQHAATALRAHVPLLIATDQEQGLVKRIGPPATQFPGNMALGADGRAVDAFEAARVTGEELRAMGVNLDFAPVADVNVDPRNPVIGIRSFGSDPARVAALTAAAVDGLQAAGIAATAKHFPGHGDTSADSHYSLPVVRHSLTQVERIDLLPFKAAIAAGVGAVMIAHIAVPSLDPSGRPATLSRPIITGWLRERMGFRGVVITDALGMQGVRTMFSDAQVAVLAIRAGADILLAPPNLPLVYRFVLQAVRRGQISVKRIDQSVRRILELKAQLGLLSHPYVRPNAVDTLVGTPQHRAVARRVAQRSITIVKVRPGVLPFRHGERVLVVGTDVQATEVVSRCLNAGGAKAQALASPYVSGGTAAGLAAASQAIVVLTSSTSGRPRQQALVNSLVLSGHPVVVVAIASPYDIAALPGVGTFLASFSDSNDSMRALAAVLLGREKAVGTLPVNILQPGSARPLFRAGFGLDVRGRRIARPLLSLPASAVSAP